jgi:diguanylate cyclase (GGDEF)-like protein/PAS domain S-box-containing protein
MNFLDIRTLILSQIVTDAICTAFLVSLWIQNRRRFAGTAYWLFDFAFQTTAVLLIVLRGSIPDWISMGLSNTLVIAGAILGYMGLTLFVGKRSSQIHNYILLVVFIAVHLFFVYVQPDLAARNLNLSLGLLIVCFQCMWLMLRRVKPGIRRTTKGVGLVFGVFCLVSIVRIVIILVSPSPSNDFFQSGTYDTLLLVAYQSLLILLTFSLVLMVNQRLVLEIQIQEEKFSNAFRSSPYAITITRLSDGQMIDVNDSFEVITGYLRAEVLGKTTLDLKLWVNEVDRINVVNELSKSNRVRGREFKFRKKSGEILTGLFSAEIIKISNQPWILSSISDITHLKYEEKVREAIYKISQATISTDSLEELYPSIQTVLGELMPVENFYIALIDPLNDLISFPYYIDQYDERPPITKPGRGLTEYVIRTGHSLLATPEVFAELIRQGEVELVGTRPVDWLGVPLIVEERIIGVMVVQSYSEGIRFNREIQTLFEFVSTQVALMIERKQAAEVLQKSNERYHRLFEDSPISLWEEDFSAVKQILDTLRQEGVTDFGSFLGSHPEVVVECAAQVKILDVNKATLVLFGSKTKENLLKNLASIFCDESYGAFQDELVKIAEGQNEFDWEGVNLTLDGRRIDISIGWSVVPGHEGDLSRVIISMIDITERKKTETKLKHLSIHDALTGLYNRAYFDEEMTQLERGQQFPVSIVMVDIDNLKEINDRQGHPTGDEFLRQAAQALRASFRVEDIVARIGGDEFAVLLPGIDATGVQNAIRRIKDNIKQQNAVRSGPPLSLSLGASTAEKGGSLVEALKIADGQMYIEKNNFH